MSDQPQPDASNLDRVVVAVDSSPAARDALRWALEAGERGGATVVALMVARDPSVYEPLGWSSAAFDPAGLIGSTSDELNQLLDELGAAERVQPLVAVGSVSSAILQESAEASLLVLGTRQLHGVSRWLGSVSDQVARHSRCPVAIVPDTAGVAMQPGAPVVVGIDGSDNSIKALRWAKAEADRRGVPTCAVLAWSYLDQHTPSGDPPFDPNYDESTARAALTEVLDGALGAEAADVQVEAVCDLPARALLSVADRLGSPLVVVGARGTGGFKGLLLGSAATKVLSTSSRPVVVVRGDEEA